jgi:hypothetical protein
MDGGNAGVAGAFTCLTRDNQTSRSAKQNFFSIR